MNKEAIVTLDNGNEVIVKKLPLGKYAEIFLALRELPKKVDLAGLEEISNEDFFSLLPEIISKSLPEVAKIISVATEVPEKAVLEELGLSEAVELLTAILIVNDFQKIVASIKKLMAQKPQTPAPKKN
jgi:hypothetical protein